MSSTNSNSTENFFFFKDSNSTYAFDSEKSLVAFKNNQCKISEKLSKSELGLPSYQCDLVEKTNKTYFSETEKYNVYKYVVLDKKHDGFDLSTQDVQVYGFEDMNVYKKYKSTFWKKNFVVPFFGKNHLEMYFPDGKKLYAGFKAEVDVKKWDSIKGIHETGIEKHLLDTGTVICDSKASNLNVNEFKLRFNPSPLGKDNKLKLSLCFLLLASKAFNGDSNYAHWSILQN